jgi:hypothetical protein
MERPARLGRYVLTLLGAVSAGAGIAFWATTGSVVGLALGAFGGVLIVLGAVQHLLYRRDQTHWPEEVLLWDEGIELVLPNGEICGASWSDPDLGLQLVARRAPPPAQREYLLFWLSDSRIPPVELSAEGFDRVTEAAQQRGLRVSHTRHGARADAAQVVHIQSPATPSSNRAAVTAGASD